MSNLIKWEPSMGMVRKGECIKCGRCCAGKFGECPHFYYLVKQDVSASTIIDKIGIPYHIEARCAISGTDEVWKSCTPKVREEFPSHPTQIKGLCSYWFETDDGRKIVYKIENSRVVLYVET